MALGYVSDPFVGQRRPTREVRVGDVGIGGANPIRVQSMTNTDTLNVAASAEQIERLANAGCEIVRLTVPSIHDAKKLREIRADLARRKLKVPLVADIHFTPNAAMIAADWVEKVRVNPGNYADKKRFEVREYEDDDYRLEIERVADRFRPLVSRCKQRGIAMRIGTNHGSLSDRIMNRFGDTPLGMVESALEFLDVCEDESYYDVVFSMKASNTQVAIHAYRLLAARLAERAGGAPSYPFHIGVTEAGDGEDGRLKSAIGMGALLEDGIGDTVRVSLTEDPVFEVPVAAALARRAEARWAEDVEATSPGDDVEYVSNPYEYERRATTGIERGELRLGADAPVRVELDLGAAPASDPEGWAQGLSARLAALHDVACEGFELHLASAEDLSRAPALRRALDVVRLRQPLVLSLAAGPELDPSRPSLKSALVGVGDAVARLVVRAGPEASARDLELAAALAAAAGVPLEWCLAAPVAGLAPLVDGALGAAAGAGLGPCVFSIDCERALHGARLLAARLAHRNAADAPIVLRHRKSRRDDEDNAIVALGTDLGAPLCDGIGDVVSLAGFDDPAAAVDLAYRTLQGARLRTTRTEFISCPSCGRTLFDLEEVTARIKARTQHLDGVKIAIMGCIVNGPGEMADADFGYVGSGPGVVTLWVGKQIRARSVPEAEAPDRLVELIRECGRWVEPGGSD